MKIFGILLVCALLVMSLSSAEIISLDPCGEKVLYEQGNGGNAEWVMENDCISIEMRKNNYDTTTEIYDKLNQRYFRLMANHIEERNNEGSGTSTTTITSMNLVSDIDDGFIRWKKENFMIGFELKGNSFKIVANITNWSYDYDNSSLWLDYRYHKNENDVISWLPVIVDGVEIPIETENRTQGQNTFISQNIGRGYEIIIDPIYYLDYDTIPARNYDNGDQFLSAYTGNFDSPNDITTIMTDGDTETKSDIEKKATGDDMIIRANFDVIYQTSHYYFLRFYKKNNNPTSITVYPHYDENNANISLSETLALSGVGWYEVDVTSLVEYMAPLINHTDLRLTETSAIDKIEVSEIMLRDEVNDLEVPVISDCGVNTTVLSCGESAKLNCSITDNYAVSYATFDVDNNYLASKNLDEYYYILSPTGYSVNNYSWSNVTACDIFNQCDSLSVDFTIEYSCIEEVVCVEDWVANYEDFGVCQINNTIQSILTYIDLNDCGTIDDLPIDNGTITENYCNYCTPIWEEHTGGIHECQINNTRYVDYYEVTNCYSVTGLPEDEPPVDIGTWVPCTYFNNDFSCSIADVPFFKGKMEYTCELPYVDTEFKCLSIVSYGFDDILQVNPQKSEKTSSLIALNNNVESREYFTTSLGLLNAYYTNKNIIPEQSFTVTTRCTDGVQILVNQVGVNPELQNLDSLPSYSVWFRENFAFIFGGLIILMIIALFSFGFIKSRGSYR